MRTRQQQQRRSAIVITRTGKRNRLIEMPWLETD
jgi:hypothetical protein